MKKFQGARLLALFVFSSMVCAEETAPPAPPIPALPVDPSELPAEVAEPEKAAPPEKKAVSLRKIQVEKTVPKYGKLEIKADIISGGQNPFDPDEISVEARLVSPSGVKKTVPGFYYAAKSGEMEGDDWRIRFSPDEPGEWDGELVVTSRGEKKGSENIEFECTLPALPSPIRVSREDPTYFEKADGSFYYPLGHNVCWGSAKDYEFHFSKMHENGENWSRIWIAAWNVEIEWSNKKPGFKGLGRYNMANAEKLDKIMEMADTYGIYLQLVMHEHCRIDTQWNPEWQNNPYNKKFGGPCEKPQDFFTNPEALRLARNRIRYIVARWGYSSRVMAWELWNEVNLGEGFDRKTDTQWHREMVQYICKIDPHRRMLTTSYAGAPNGDVFSMPEIDFTQLHVYDEDIVPKLIEWTTAFAEFKKPYFVGEFGRASKDGVDRQDKKGMFLHSGIWAQFMMPSAGNAMSWWWYDLIRPANLFYRFGTLNAFATGIDRRGQKWNWQYGGLTKDPKSPRIVSMASPTRVMFWIYDPAILPYTKKMPETMPGIENEIVIENLSPGKWSVAKWEPYNSRVPSRAVPHIDETSVDGSMTIKIKANGPDCAYRMQLSEKGAVESDKLPSLKIEPWDAPGSERPVFALSIPKQKAPVTIDGDLADWAGTTFIPVEPMVGDTRKTCSFQFAITHDNVNLMVACKVRDDELIRMNKGDNVWKDDCVELWIDAHKTASKFYNMPNHPGLYQINFAPPASGSGEAEVVFFRNPGSSEKIRQGVKAVSKKTAEGYDMEISIPLAALRGADKALAPKMGFNISICDADKGSEKKPIWYHLLWQGSKEEDATEWSTGTLE
jgi:cellulose/xylan binding protein with CBM9 domain/uncharacterized protein DUF5060/cellulase (glycosyl hydrolase family 5)